MQTIDISKANGQNRWVVTCPRDLLDEKEQQFDAFMEKITSYMGLEVVGELIGVTKGEQMEPPSREITRPLLEDTNIEYLKKIGMYAEKPSPNQFPLQKRQNTQFVYRPKTNSKAWYKVLFPEQSKSSSKSTSTTTQKPQKTQQLNTQVNMSPTLAP